MGKLENNETGFGVVEIVMMIVILGLIGIVGWLVYKNHHSSPTHAATTLSAKPITTTKTTTPSPYAGWNTYTLKLEKITFHYPSSWKLKNMSDSNNDFVILTGSNNFQMTIGAGAAVSDAGFPFGGSYVVQADPITFLGKPGYIDLWTDEGNTSTSIYSMWVSSSSTQAHDFFPSKNIKPNASNSYVVVLMDYQAPSATNFTNEPLSYVEADPNFKDAKLIISSMTY